MSDPDRWECGLCGEECRDIAVLKEALQIIREEGDCWLSGPECASDAGAPEGRWTAHRLTPAERAAATYPRDVRRTR